MNETSLQKIDRYEIRDRIGVGGSARVFRAWDTSLDRFVAVKILHEHLADDPSFKERFEREAKFVASFNHPNIVQIYDFHISAQNEIPLYYMVMPYVSGASLRQVLEQAERTHQRLPFARVLSIIDNICAALEYAHSRGMAHRDIKPGNILINERGEAVLTDFGIARLVDSTRLTQEGVSTGTPTYMSPEQAGGEPGDTRSDIYSLGIILFEMLTGTAPFLDESGMAIMLKHINQAVPSIAKQLGITHPGLDTFIKKALAKDPADRFQTAKAFIATLRPLLEDASLDPLADQRTLVITNVQPSLHGTNPVSRSTPVSTPLTTRGNRPATTGFIQTLTQQALSHPQTSTGILVFVIVTIIILLIVVLVNQTMVRDLLSSQSISSQSAPTVRPELIPPVQSETGYFRSTFSERDATRPNWPISESAPFIRAFTADGRYALTNTAPQSARSTAYTSSVIFGNISVAMEAELTLDSVPNSAYGIVFRYQDETNFNVFAVDGAGRYSIWVLENGDWRELRAEADSWTPNDAVNPQGESNQLSIDIIGDRYTAYVNNRRVTEVNDDTFGEGGVGIYIAADDGIAEVLVDTYHVYSSVPSMTGP